GGGGGSGWGAAPRGRAPPCCSRRRARASTCSATTSTGARCSARRWKVGWVLRAISPGRTAPAEYDSGVLWAALLLLTFGTVMVYSSSIAIPQPSKFTRANPPHLLHL